MAFWDLVQLELAPMELAQRGENDTGESISLGTLDPTCYKWFTLGFSKLMLSLHNFVKPKLRNSFTVS